MNGVRAAGAFPATAVLRIATSRPMKPIENSRAEDVILAAVTHPPRIGDTRPLAALMPQVLARYGLAEEAAINPMPSVTSIDLLA